MALPDWLTVVPRPSPSATLSFIHGPDPILIDPGSLTDADVLPTLVASAGSSLEDINTVVCTHYHSDHVGAVALLQHAGTQVAAHQRDAATVNARDPQACAAKWLDQPVLPYHVDRALSDGDVISTGLVDLQVVHTPGHTLGAVSLWEPGSRTLICGDALDAENTPWIGTPHEGADSLLRSTLTLDRIEALDPALIVSGHGPLITDAAAVITRNRDRLASWAKDPAACAMYAAKRIFIYRLMLEAIPVTEVRPYLTNSAWLRDLSATTDDNHDTFAERLLTALAPNLTVETGLLCTTVPHRQSHIPIPWRYVDPGRWNENDTPS